MSEAGESRQPSIRQRRVEELLAHELTLILQSVAHDPRLAGATVTGVRISRDLRRATVLVSGSDREHAKEMLKALEHSNAFFRRELGRRAYLRYLPELQFQIDDSLDRAQRIESLLEQVALEAPEAAEPDAE
jgi:ribosome-binding factor A